jgi:hypothetical protein
MKRISILVLVSLLALFSAGCQMVMGGNYVLHQGETLSDDLYIGGGDSTLEQGSRVTGSLIVTGGMIQANGEIDGDVPVSGGYVVFGPSAVVRGVVQKSGGAVSLEPGATIRIVDGYGTSAASRGLEMFILMLVLLIAVVVLLLTMRPENTVGSGAAAVQTGGDPGSPSNPIRAQAQRVTQLGGAIAVGIILISLGFLFLLQQLLNLSIWRIWHYGWSIFPLAAGFLLFAIMVLGGKGTAKMAIPGSIVTMIGLVLLYQTVFDQYQSWSYAWALVIPTSIGVGRYIRGWWEDRPDLRARGRLEIRIGLILFVALAVFFEMFLNLSGFFTGALSRFAFPVLLMAGGVLVVLSRLLNRPSSNMPLESPSQAGSAPSASRTSDTLPPSGG